MGNGAIYLNEELICNSDVYVSSLLIIFDIFKVTILLAVLTLW